MFGGHCRHKMMLLTSALLMTLLSLTAEAEFFSALGDMRTLLDHQHNFVGKLDNYVKEEEERLHLIKQFLGKIESRFGGPQVGSKKKERSRPGQKRSGSMLCYEIIFTVYN